MVLTATAFPAQAQEATTDICGRTQAVVDEILRVTATAGDECGSVSVSEMANIWGAFIDDFSLENKNITGLKPGDFEGLSGLLVLELGMNHLAELQPGTFSGLTFLGTLELNDNSLTALPSGVFSGLTSLTRLALSDNSLAALPSDVFSGLTDLSSLELENNSLAALPSGVFSGLTDLTHLELADNSLETLPSGVFAGLTNLVRLELDDNSLETLPFGVFSGLDSLERIFLNDNRLRELPSGVFPGSANLEWIFLNDNQLKRLPAGTFSRLTAIVWLDLRDNPGAPFRFTVRFEPKRLDKDFITASVRLVLREGAPRPVTVPLSATGASLSVNSLTLALGSTQSDVITITRTPGNELFELNQGELELGELRINSVDPVYRGFDIVRGPSLTTASATRVRIRAFLEGALE